MNKYTFAFIYIYKFTFTLFQLCVQKLRILIEDSDQNCKCIIYLFIKYNNYVLTVFLLNKFVF